MSNPPAKASTQVAMIPELLHAILVHLPPRDLLLSQRAHPVFGASIANSLELPRRLFRQFSPTYPDRSNIAHPDNYSPALLHECGLRHSLKVSYCPIDKHGKRLLVEEEYKECEPRVTLDVLTSTPIRFPADLSPHGASSYLAILLQRHPAPVRISLYNTDEIKYPGLDARWSTAAVTVRRATLLELKDIWVGLKEAAYAIQRDGQYENDWCHNVQDMIAYERPLPVDSYKITDHFTTEQFEAMVDEVDIVVMACDRYSPSHGEDCEA